MDNQIRVIERYYSLNGRTYMETSLEPGMWREVPVMLLPPPSVLQEWSTKNPMLDFLADV